jgi:hypothetical protein
MGEDHLQLLGPQCHGWNLFFPHTSHTPTQTPFSIHFFVFVCGGGGEGREPFYLARAARDIQNPGLVTQLGQFGIPEPNKSNTLMDVRCWQDMCVLQI